MKFGIPTPLSPERPWTYSPTGGIRHLCPFCDWHYDEPSPCVVIKPGQTISEACDESFAVQHAEIAAAIRGHLTEHTAAVMLSDDPDGR